MDASSLYVLDIGDEMCACVRGARAMGPRRARGASAVARGIALAVVAVAVAARSVGATTGRRSSAERTLEHRGKRDVVVVVSLDGVVRALDSGTGDVAWSFDSGGALAGASWERGGGGDADAATRRAGADFVARRAGDVDSDVERGRRNVFPGVDGALYAHHVGREGKHVVRRLPVTTRELVDASPSATADGALVVGRRSSTIYALNPRTGGVVRVVNVDGSTTSVDADEVDDEGELIYVGRTEYVVRSVDAASGAERWNVTHGELRSLTRDSSTGTLKIGTDRAPSSGSFAIGPGNTVRSVDARTGKTKWTHTLTSLPLGVSDASGHVVVDNMAQIHGESDDKIIIGAHEGGLFALPYTASAAAGLPDGGDASNALVPTSGRESFVRIDVESDADDWSCIPDELVKATLDKTSGQSRVPRNEATRAALNALLVGGVSVIVVFFAKRSQDSSTAISDAPSTGDEVEQLSAAAKKRAKKRAKQAEARAAEEELKAKILASVEEKTREETRIGRLLIEPTVLGYGSCGTIVFAGEMDGRRVAVKRLLAQFHELARKELDALIASDEHPNILRCFALEEDENFVYMALELCASSLAHLVDPVDTGDNVNVLDIKCVNAKTKYPTPECMRIMYDVISGLAALHERGIVHRDLKPQNVLITASGRGKIADMGLAKRVNIAEGTSFETHVAGGPNANSVAGTSGWQAPERLSQGRQSRSVDVFSFGCLMYYALTGGSHPFGSKLQRDSNVMANKSDVSKLTFFPEAQALVRSCIDANPSVRPSAKDILSHPIWWDAGKKIQFLIDASDRVEMEDRVSDRTLLRELEKRAKGAIACEDWTKKLDPALLENMGRYREYNGASVRDLLRVIRNKANHYRELPPKLQRALGSYPDGLWQYLSIRFPSLLLCVRDFFAPTAESEPTLAKYYVDHASSQHFAPPLGTPEPVSHAPMVAPQIFPERPGRELCEFYMKTGRCKFGASCRFHHPRDAGHWDVPHPASRGA